jgi:glycosidase
MGDPAACNVADQEADVDSVLAFTRRAIAARRQSDDLSVGPYRSLPSPAGTWAYARGEGTVVALNMSERAQAVEATGTIALSTERTLEGSAVEGALTLAPWTGVVITS